MYREGFGGHFDVADFRQILLHGVSEAFLSEIVVSTLWIQNFIRRVFEKMGHFDVADFRQILLHGVSEAFLSEIVVSTLWIQNFIRRVFEKITDMFAFVSELVSYVRVWT